MKLIVDIENPHKFCRA